MSVAISHDQLKNTIQTKFKLASFRPGQEEAIQRALSGRHLLVVMPTGAGKSLVYQLLALYFKGTTIVISPLIALMQDQVMSLKGLGIPATFINSSLPTSVQQDRLRRMIAGEFRLVYVAPERLRSIRFQATLKRAQVDLLAVDEAHCISQWGHDFRPDYRHISDARRLMGDPITIALTATATPEVQKDIIQALDLSQGDSVITGFNRPNLTFRVRYAADLETKYKALYELYKSNQDGAAIVYVGTRRDAEEVASFIRDVCKSEAEFYHAGLDAQTRYKLQEAFSGAKLSTIVATVAFGMGIDRPDVRRVIHFSVPGTLEAYYQEAGRAGRDGFPAEAILLYDPQDRALQEWFIETSALSRAELWNLYDVIPGPAGGAPWIGENDLSLRAGLDSVKIRLGLEHLEKVGAVERLGGEGVHLQLRRSRWDEQAIKAIVALARARKRYQGRQLVKMIDYAESNSCRRRLLLNHFGDKGSSEAESCCDNCLIAQEVDAPQPKAVEELSQSERAGLIILDAVRRLPWKVGKLKLAQLLQGSKAKAMRQFGYDRSRYYGRLAVFRQSEIKMMIEQLTDQGYLKAVGGHGPVLRLTPQGEISVRNKASIQLELPREISSKRIALKKAERAAGGTVRLTKQMLRQGLEPAWIASERGLTENTIYGHLAHLIENSKISLSTVMTDVDISKITEAAAQAGSTSTMSEIKMFLPESISYGQISCVLASLKKAEFTSVDKGISSFLSGPHPFALKGPWDIGWALDYHSRYVGATWERGELGQMLYRLKYKQDKSVLSDLAAQLSAFAKGRPPLMEVEAIVPVPSTSQRGIDPVSSLARALGAELKRPVWPILTKTRQNKPQKEMRTLIQKQENVAGVFKVTEPVQGKRLLVIDDLHDSGATLSEVSRTLRRRGAAYIAVLTMTRTIHTDR